MQVKRNKKSQTNHGKSKAGETPRDHPAKPTAAVKTTRSNALATLQLEVERNQAEKALQESKEKYRALLETSTDNILTHDLEGRVIYIDPSGLRITEYSEAAEEISISAFVSISWMHIELIPVMNLLLSDADLDRKGETDNENL